MKKDCKYADKISILEEELNKLEYEQIFTRDE